MNKFEQGATIDLKVARRSLEDDNNFGTFDLKKLYI